MTDETNYEVLRLFATSYRGRCTLDFDHLFKPGDLVARLQRADNPMLPVPGVACSRCWKLLPRAAA